MENTKEAICVPLNAGWSDIGSWSSYWETFDKDDNGNVFNADVIAKDVKNTLIKGNDNSLLKNDNQLCSEVMLLFHCL